MKYVILAVLMAGCSSYTTSTYLPKTDKVLITKTTMFLAFYFPQAFLCTPTAQGLGECESVRVGEKHTPPAPTMPTAPKQKSQYSVPVQSEDSPWSRP